MDLSYIIPPVNRELLLQELTPDKWIRKTNKLDNDIYIVNHHTAPNTMQEIGHLRELTFAQAGGGTGQPVDIDTGYTSDLCYNQTSDVSP